MSIKTSDHMWSVITELRYQPTEKRIRAWLGDELALDSRRAVLVMEPWRVVPSYAVPRDDLRLALESAPAGERTGEDTPSKGTILHPGIAFAVHSGEGEVLELVSSDGARRAGGYELSDEALSGLVVLDFAAFDRWCEEDETIHGHPRDPYHRVDVRQSSRRIRVKLDGELLATSSRPQVVFETSLPVRFYLPREDVVAPLKSSGKRTFCAYKGEAAYVGVEVGGRWRPDLAWVYDRPLPDAAALAGHLCFFDEFVDVVVDDHERSRPTGGISDTILEEAGISSS